MSEILKLDFFLTDFLRNFLPHNLIFNSFFSFLSIRGLSFLFWVIIILFLIYLEERKNPGISKKDKQFIFSFLFAFFLTILIVEIPLKNFFRRQRPYVTTLNQSILRFRGQNPHCFGFSFPSGHAATAFASATILAFFDKKRKWFYYLVATLIAYSRIFLSCHYFFDVVVGGILGFVIGKMVLNIRH